MPRLIYGSERPLPRALRPASAIRRLATPDAIARNGRLVDDGPQRRGQVPVLEGEAGVLKHSRGDVAAR